MATGQLHVVTGAFGFSGKYLARRLLDAGHRVRTLTNSPDRPHPFGPSIEVAPLCFDRPDALAESLRGAAVLYNTYWVRFNHRGFSHGAAVRNTQTLFDAAARAGVGRIVHVSITNPSEDSPLEYFRDKARLERALVASGMAHSILRPAILFGDEDILVNNMAWSIRRFPIIPLFGRGDCPLQPIHVDDLARLAVEEGLADENRVVQAIGPETFTYRQLVQTLVRILGRRRLLVRVPPRLAYWGATVMGKLLGDVILTWDELQGMMAGLLAVDAPPTGRTRLTDWAAEHADRLGRRYASELARRRDRTAAYDRT